MLRVALVLVVIGDSDSYYPGSGPVVEVVEVEGYSECLRLIERVENNESFWLSEMLGTGQAFMSCEAYEDFDNLVTSYGTLTN